MGSKAVEMLQALHYNGLWMPRNEDLETNRQLRQVIPYVVVTNTKTHKFMVLERMKTQAEARLHGDICLGAGGHLEQPDVETNRSVIEAGAWRELTEETGFATGTLGFVGIVCVTDPGEEIVHHVHIGAVYHLFTEEENFTGELDQQNHKWLTKDEVAALLPRMETWARIVAVRYLGMALPEA